MANIRVDVLSRYKNRTDRRRRFGSVFYLCILLGLPSAPMICLAAPTNIQLIEDVSIGEEK